MKITKQLLETIVREELSATLQEMGAATIRDTGGKRYLASKVEPLYDQVLPMVKASIGANNKFYRNIAAALEQSRGKEMPSNIVLGTIDAMFEWGDPTEKQEMAMNKLQEEVIDRLAEMESKL